MSLRVLRNGRIIAGSTALATAALLGTGALLAGCAASPPPALPAKVMEQGADAVPEEHPKLTEAQLAVCGTCHRSSDSPAP